MTAILTSWNCPRAGSAWTKAVLSISVRCRTVDGSVRWRTADGHVSRVPRRNAAAANEARIVALCLAASAGPGLLDDAGLAPDRRALAVHSDHGSEREGRRPLETVQRFRRLLLVLRRPRHGARSARAPRGRPACHRPLGQTVSL